MRKLWILFLLSFVFSLQAAELSNIEIIAPSTARVGEAIDVTVQALDENGDVYEDYDGIIFFFSSSDDSAVLPFEEEWYEFQPEDKGKKVFSKGVIFQTIGKQELEAVDLLNDKEIDATVSIEVSASYSGSLQEAETVDLEIFSPETNTTISDSTVTVAGKTKENSIVIISVNDQEYETQSNSTGIFSYNVSDLSSWEYTIVVEVIDGNEDVLAKSSEINIRVDSEWPTFTSIEMQDSAVITESVPVVVYSEPDLKNVSVSLGWEDYNLHEGDVYGTYSWTIIAPDSPANYEVDVQLESISGLITEKKSVETLEVISPKIINEVSSVEGNRVTFNFGLDTDADFIKKFLISYTDESGTEMETFTSSKEDIVDDSGEYSWYLDLSEWIYDNVVIHAVGVEDTVLPITSSEMTFTIVLPKIINEVSSVEGNRVTFNFGLDTDADFIKKFLISYTDESGTEMETFTSSKEDIVDDSGEYSWYLDLSEWIYDNVVIHAVGVEDTVLPITSSEMTFTIDNSKGEPINVSGLTTHVSGTTSVLEWKEIPYASSYEIYKKDASGNYVFVDRTEKNEYKIYFTGDEVQYENFSVRAIFNGEEGNLTSPEYSEMVQVQTGPVQYLILFVLAGFAGLFFVRRFS